MDERTKRPSAEALLAELGIKPQITVYLASAPGAGKTRRILEDAIAQSRAGKRVAIGWVETKNRPDLDALVEQLARIAPRRLSVGETSFEEFDFEAAAASGFETIVLDELAHTNVAGSTNAKRWEDALALRDRFGKSIIGAFNVQHLETVAPVAERIINYPIREIVPVSFLKSADQVIALDVTTAVLESRLQSGRIVRTDDIDRAASGVFKPQNLQMLRELLLRTVDDLTVPLVSARKTSTALALVPDRSDAGPFLKRVHALADALDLALEVAAPGRIDAEALERAARVNDASVVRHPEAIFERCNFTGIKAGLIAVPTGALARKILAGTIDRDLYVVDPTWHPSNVAAQGARHPYGQSAGDRLRIGYGKLTIYLGSVAGSGKTYAMLDRAHQLVDEGVDVLAALVETHGRADTLAKLDGFAVLPRRPDGELDREALVLRNPQVALIDELAHTNPPGSLYPKRFDEVISVLRLGISVITTLNVQHLDGLSDVVFRLTDQRVRETVPDSILELADDVIFIDVTPQVLRERLRAGKIYPRERIEAALNNFFRTENLAALRELSVREMMRARAASRPAPPFERIVLGVAARERDRNLIARMGRLASRLEIDLVVSYVAGTNDLLDDATIDSLSRAARAQRARWIVTRNDDMAAGLVALARDERAVLAVEGARTRKRFFNNRKPVALRAIEAGASDMFVLAPLDEPTGT